VKVRPWTLQDTRELLKWIKEDPEILRQFGFSGKADDVEIVDFMAVQSRRTDAIYLAGDSGGSLSGMACASNINADGSALVHQVTAPEHRGKGGFLLRAAVHYAFNVIGLKTLTALVPNDNARAYSLDVGLGFED